MQDKGTASLCSTSLCLHVLLGGDRMAGAERVRLAAPLELLSGGRLAPGLLTAGDLGGEGIELVVPEAPEWIEPLLDFLERAGVDRIEPALGVRPHVREPVVPQHAQVLRDRRLADPELGCDYLDDRPRAALSIGKQLQDPSPHGVTENVECVHQAPVSALLPV